MYHSAVLKRFTIEQWDEWMVYTLLYKLMVLEQVSRYFYDLTISSLSHCNRFLKNESVPCSENTTAVPLALQKRDMVLFYNALVSVV